MFSNITYSTIWFTKTPHNMTLTFILLSFPQIHPSYPQNAVLYQPQTHLFAYLSPVTEHISTYNNGKE